MSALALGAVFLPLVGSALALTRDYGPRLAVGAMALSASSALILAITMLWSEPVVVVEIARWIESGPVEVDWRLRLDTLSVVMITTVTVVSTLVHVYSLGYMADDSDQGRFFAYLSLFTFAMLMLVSSDNLVQLFFGWEGVGLCSYLLIGFWFHKSSANDAAIKAFVVNRVGDFAFILGLCALFALYNTLQFDSLFHRITISSIDDSFLGLSVLEWTGLLIFVGAMGKSAQIGLHIWLPDAMEGPTPVSALIHAATMVTAGVFVIARLSPFYQGLPITLDVIAVTGALTALVAAIIATVQIDIKRAIAWSTCSQLGFMFLALGLSAWGVAIFHLFTHAFFKALLFLASGVVIHALAGQQDMTKMGGLRRLLPKTYWCSWGGVAALAGWPFFSGYFSKEIIFGIAWGQASLVSRGCFIMALVAAFFTAFYALRVIFLTFHGTPKWDQKNHIHENPVMVYPLMPLAFGAVVAGGIGYSFFVGSSQVDFWRQSFDGASYERALMAAEHSGLAHFWPLLASLLALVVSMAIYVKGWYLVIPSTILPIIAFIRAGLRIDDLYRLSISQPLSALARSLARGDGAVVDRFGPDGLAWQIIGIGQRVAWLHSGYLYHYILAVITGLVVFLLGHDVARLWGIFWQ